MRTDTKRLVVVKLGSSRITGLLCFRNEAGALVPLSMSERPTGDSFRYGMISNTTAVASLVSEVLEELRAQTLEDHEYIDQVFVGIEGISMRTYPERVGLELSEEGELVTHDHLNRLKSQVEEIPRDGLKVIHIDAPYVYLDGVLERNYISVRAKAIEAVYPVVCIKEEHYRNIRTVFEEKLEVRIAGIIPTPLAEARRSLLHTELLLGAAYINIGGGTTSLVVMREDLLSALYVLPIGGGNVTQDISEKLRILPGDAEELKRSHVSLDLQADRDKEIEARAEGEDSGRKIKISEVNRYAHARMREIVANVQHLLEGSGLEESVQKNPYVFAGGAIKLRGFDDFIQKQLDRSLRIAKTMRAGISERVSGEELERWFTELSIASMAEDVDCIGRTERSLSDLEVSPQESKPRVEPEARIAPETPVSELRFSEITPQPEAKDGQFAHDEGDLFGSSDASADEDLPDYDEWEGDEEEEEAPIQEKKEGGLKAQLNKFARNIESLFAGSRDSDERPHNPTYTEED